MENNNYKVIILKSTEPTDAVAEKLAGLFKISLEKANSILQKDTFVIKKQTDKKTAEKFHKAIITAGANCRIEEIIPQNEPALPTIEEVESSAEAKPLIDPTKPAITPLQTEQMNLSLDAAPVEKSTSADKDKLIEDINPDNFCPECGTIRASADSVCIHCGYDPVVIKRSNTKATLTKIIIAIIIIAIIAIIGLPFYQKYTKRLQIEDDLKLAFDARNSVTEFIQRTNFWPNQNIDAGLPKQISNQSVKSVIVGENSIITVTLKAEVLDGSDQTLIFTPNILKGHIVWNCLKGTLKDEFRPGICLKQQAEK